MSDLKPCPFCGKYPLVNWKYIHGVANRKHYWVECIGGCVKQKNEYRYKNKAIEAWNRRSENE